MDPLEQPGQELRGEQGKAASEGEHRNLKVGLHLNSLGDKIQPLFIRQLAQVHGRRFWVNNFTQVRHLLAAGHVAGRECPLRATEFCRGAFGGRMFFLCLLGCARHLSYRFLSRV